MEMTLDGLVKALRLKAHGLAEDAEAGYVLSRARPRAERRRQNERNAQEGKERDERGR